jgi:hypothetical protein
VNPAEETIVADVDKYGWHVINVLPKGTHPPHTFSIGLFRTFKHPEVVIFGLKGAPAHSFISNIVEDVTGGTLTLSPTCAACSRSSAKSHSRTAQ